LIVQKKTHFLGLSSASSTSPPTFSPGSSSFGRDDDDCDEEHFDTYEEWLNMKNDEGVSPLLAACATGQLQVSLLFPLRLILLPLLSASIIRLHLLSFDIMIILSVLVLIFMRLLLQPFNSPVSFPFFCLPVCPASLGRRR
jgi:hypothetical protein